VVPPQPLARDHGCGDARELGATMLAMGPNVVVDDDRFPPNAPAGGAPMIVVGADDDPGFRDRAEWRVPGRRGRPVVLRSHSAAAIRTAPRDAP